MTKTIYGRKQELYKIWKDLKETYIEELEDTNSQLRLEAKTYKAMIKAIFESL